MSHTHHTRAEDVLDAAELAAYRSGRAAARHVRACRDPFCATCNPEPDHHAYTHTPGPKSGHRSTP